MATPTAKNHQTVSQNSRYVIEFSSLLNRKTEVTVLDSILKQTETHFLSIFEDELGYGLKKILPPIAIDIIDLAIAIDTVDRLIKPDFNKQKSKICVVLPIRNPEKFNSISVQKELSDLLQWSTGNDWKFQFKKCSGLGRRIEQDNLLLPKASPVDEVTLWSGGLDALAGLYTRLTSDDKKSFMLFGTGANSTVFKRQHTVFKQLQQEFANRVSLSRLRFSLEYQDKRSQKNKMLRTRGVVFTLLGSAYAYLMDCNVLNLYENGIGAINLPSESTVGLDHSRSTHPLTLLKVSNLVSDILGGVFKIRNPFLFSTKAQMCQSLTRDKKADLSELTQSCDRPHRCKPVQCGYCSSCILRRQALLASNLNDKNHYIVPHARQATDEDCIYLDNMYSQVNTLRKIFEESKTRQSQWRSLTKTFPVLDDIVDQTATIEGVTEEKFRINLIKLFQAYIDEWGHVESHLWRDFSRNPIGSHKTRDIVP